MLLRVQRKFKKIVGVAAVSVEVESATLFF